MQCPHCSYQPLPENARYCPQCSQPVEVAARVKIDARVGENYGQVIGVQTQALNGDVYGGDIYQVQVYVLSEAGRSDATERFLERNTPPYPYLQPFTARDRRRFCGRDGEVRQALTRLGASRLLVLYGPAGVGKTSLLAAGLIPQLAEDGALAVHVRDWTAPLAETLWKALSASKQQLDLPLRQGAPLPELLQSVQQATEGTLVLVLDQCEALFHPDYPAELRLSQFNALVDSLKAVPAEYLRLVLAVRDDALLRLSDLQEALPDLFRTFMELKPLDQAQARQAILDPNKYVAQPLFFADGMVDDLLLPELDALTRDAPNSIFPPHLQIVCRWLYDQVQRRGERMATPELYLNEGRGAEGILVSHLEETLRTRLAERSRLASQALAALAALGEGAWAGAGDLGLSGADLVEVSQTLDSLAETGLLLRVHSAERAGPEGATLYAFASEMLLEAVEQRHGEQIQELARARRDLQRLWYGWKASSDLPSARQVERLQAAMPRLAPEPLHALLLLRAAAEARLPAAPWVRALRTPAGRALSAALEGLPEVENAQAFTPSDLLEARRLTGIQPDASTGSPGPGETSPGSAAPPPCGALALSAVNGSDAGTRQAAALALLACDPYQAADRIGWAMSSLHGIARLRRQAELSGALLEADPGAAAPLASKLSSVERLAAWFWRLGHRTAANAPRLGRLALGAFLGSGLALAALRFLTAFSLHATPQLFAMNAFIYGGLTGAGLLFGLELSHLLPRGASSRARSSPDAGETAPATPVETPHRLLSAGISALFAWLAYLFAVFTSGQLGFSGKGFNLGLGALLALGFSLILSLPPRRSETQSRAWLRAGLAAIWSGAIGLLPVLLGEIARTAVIFTPAAAFRAGLNTPANQAWVAWLVNAMPDAWFSLIAVLDAALAGGLLIAGLLLGATATERRR